MILTNLGGRINHWKCLCLVEEITDAVFFRYGGENRDDFEQVAGIGPGCNGGGCDIRGLGWTIGSDMAS